MDGAHRFVSPPPPNKWLKPVAGWAGHPSEDGLSYEGNADPGST